MKYLLATTQCDDKHAEIPDLYVLPMSKDLVGVFSRTVNTARNIATTRRNFKAMEFEFTKGYWLCIKDAEWIEKALGENVSAVIELENIVAMVGEAVIAERLIIEVDGDVSFRCLHDESNLYVWASAINIAQLETEV